MATKWFYKAQNEATEELDKRFADRLCLFQMVSTDRVVELWQCSDVAPKKMELMQVVITKQATRASVNIYKVEFQQGWRVETD